MYILTREVFSLVVIAYLFSFCPFSEDNGSLRLLGS